MMVVMLHQVVLEILLQLLLHKEIQVVAHKVKELFMVQAVAVVL